MTAPLILLVHASDANALATLAARRLQAAGFRVDQCAITAPAALAQDVNQAQRVIVLWSKGVASAKDATRQLEAIDRLCVVRLASTPTPTRLRSKVHRLPRMNESDASWRAWAQGVETAPTKPKAAHAQTSPGSRLHGLLVLVVMSLVTMAAAYAAYPPFAAQLRMLAQFSAG